MNRVLAYDPQDLTLGVEPGVRIEELLRVLAEQKQFLPLAVPFLDRATIGGIVAQIPVSPLRHAYGGVRDFCLGMEFVTGEGIAAKSGGRVVKNVTGYDLHKLLIGSLGTLGGNHAREFPHVSIAPGAGNFVGLLFRRRRRIRVLPRDRSFGLSRRRWWKSPIPRPRHLIFSAEPGARSTPLQWSVIISAAGQPEVVDRYARELGHMAGTAERRRICAARRR